MAQGKQSEAQRKQIALQVWVDNPLLTYQEICKLAGISDKTFYRYRKDPEFMSEYKKMCEQRFNSLEAKAIAQLEGCLDDRNFQAIKFVLENMGYKPADKIDATVDANTSLTISIEE